MWPSASQRKGSVQGWNKKGNDNKQLLLKSFPMIPTSIGRKISIPKPEGWEPKSVLWTEVVDKDQWKPHICPGLYKWRKVRMTLSPS